MQRVIRHHGLRSDSAAISSIITAELLAHILPHLPLKSLITARGVNHEWRKAIDLADLHPARHELLQIYLQISTADWFLDGRKWTLENLYPFDRQAYLDALLAQYHWLPEDFCIWILEWPARAAFSCSWPGLPHEDYNAQSNVHRIEGMNGLGVWPPRVHNVCLQAVDWGGYDDDDENKSDPLGVIVELVPAIRIWVLPEHEVWMLLGGGEEFQGRVFRSAFGSTIVTGLVPKDELIVASTWVAWLRYQKCHLAGLGKRIASCKFVRPQPPRKFPLPTPWSSSRTTASMRRTVIF